MLQKSEKRNHPPWHANLLFTPSPKRETFCQYFSLQGSRKERKNDLHSKQEKKKGFESKARRERERTKKKKKGGMVNKNYSHPADNCAPLLPQSPQFYTQPSILSFRCLVMYIRRGFAEPLRMKVERQTDAGVNTWPVCRYHVHSSPAHLQANY